MLQASRRVEGQLALQSQRCRQLSRELDIARGMLASGPAGSLEAAAANVPRPTPNPNPTASAVRAWVTLLSVQETPVCNRDVLYRTLVTALLLQRTLRILFSHTHATRINTATTTTYFYFYNYSL